MKLVRPKKRCNDSVVTLTSDFAIPLKNFSDEQIEEIKDSLTFNNPAYTSAKRFSPYSKVYVDPLITYYHSSCGYLHVPAGTDLSPLNDPPVHLQITLSRGFLVFPQFKDKLGDCAGIHGNSFILNRWVI